jgi:hypothetical protein
VFVLWTRLRVSFNAYVDPLFEIPSDSSDVNPTTNDMMTLYYCLMTKVDALLGGSRVLSWVGCHSWYQSDYMHQSLINNLNHWFLNKIGQDCFDLQNTLVR